MTRTPTVTKDLVSAKFRDAFERVTADSGDRIDSGPGWVMINSPEIEKVPIAYVGGDAYANTPIICRSFSLLYFSKFTF